MGTLAVETKPLLVHDVDRGHTLKVLSEGTASEAQAKTVKLLSEDDKSCKMVGPAGVTVGKI